MDLIINDWFYTRWLLVLALVGAWAIWKHAKAFKIWLTYSWLSGFVAILFRYNGDDAAFDMQVKQAIFHSLFWIALSVLCTNIKLDRLKACYAISVLLAFSFACELFKFPISGIGVNDSINSTLMALCFSVFIWAGKKITFQYFLCGFGLTFTTMIFHGATMGPAALVSGIIWWLFHSLGYKKALKYAVPVAITFFIPALFVGEKYFVATNRFEIWTKAYRLATVDLSHILFGWGHGAWKFIGPWTQELTNSVGEGYFLTLHNDWLQMFFEGGVIGVALFAFELIRLSLKTGALAYLCAALGVSMIGNFPLQLPLETMVFFMIVGNECLSMRKSRPSAVVS